MNWKVIVDVAIKAAQAVPTAIALAACAVEFCEEIISGALEDATTDAAGEQTEMAKQVATIVRAFRRIKAFVWPWSTQTKVDEAMDAHFEPEQLVLPNIIQLKPSG